MRFTYFRQSSLLITLCFTTACQPEPKLEEMNENETKDTAEMVVKVRKKSIEDDSDYVAGRRIYATKCTPCHMIEAKFLAPALKGTRGRWNNDKKLYDFIQHPEKYYDTDPYVLKLKRESFNALMSSKLVDAKGARQVMKFIDHATAKEDSVDWVEFERNSRR